MSKTIVEVKRAVLVFLTQEDILNVLSDAELVKFECENSSLKVGLITTALIELESFQIVKKVEGIPDTWALTKPLIAHDRTITVSLETTLSLSEALDGYYTLAKSSEKSDPLALTENDLKKAGLIIKMLLLQKQNPS